MPAVPVPAERGVEPVWPSGLRALPASSGVVGGAMFFGVRGKTQVLLQHQPPWRHQETTFKVGCTDLSGGLSISEYSSRLFLHNYVHPHDIRTIMASFDVVPVSLELSLCCTVLTNLTFFLFHIVQNSDL